MKKIKKASALILVAVMMIVSMSTSAFAMRSVSTREYEEKILQEQRAELRAIWNNYSHFVDESNNTSGRYIDPGFTGIGTVGSILIALDSLTDHVGIVVDTYTVIEAHQTNPNGGVDYRDNNWASRYNSIKGLNVNNANYGERVNAVAYARQQIGEPYNILANRWSENEWYCSKLVWRSWYEQGYDIEGRTGEPKETHITPGDILDSPLTSIFYAKG